MNATELELRRLIASLAERIEVLEEKVASLEPDEEVD
jgi:hypothetical protein